MTDQQSGFPAEVTDWVRRHAHPLAGTEADAALPGLSPLRDIVGDAAIVGIGGSTYGAHEQFTLTTAVIRYLVTELGFRAVATEDDWDVALGLDRYVVHGEGDLDELVRDNGVPWRTTEIRDAVEWLREYNRTQDDPVRFVGVGVIDTRPVVYDLVTEYVQRADPDRIPLLDKHFAEIRPTRPDHVRWFFTEADRTALTEHARAALTIVESVPHQPGDAAHELAVQHTRQIVGFHEHYTHHVIEDGYRDRMMAENLVWWHEHTGQRIAYWSTIAHSVRSEQLTISIPPKGTLEFTPTGWHLRERFGTGYVSLGLTFEHGEVISGWGVPPFQPRPMSAPARPAGSAESPLSAADGPYLLDLRASADGPARAWLDGEFRTRVIGSVCAPSEPPEDYWQLGGTLAEWFDAVLHHEQATPTQGL